MITMLIDVHSPTMNVTRDTTQGHSFCRILSIKNGDGNWVRLHFDTKEDIVAFLGMTQMLANQLVGESKHAK